MPDGTIMNADGSIVDEDGSDMSDSTHTMDDGTVMTDKVMHMETMHDGEEIDDHGSDTHGDHE
jgi:hypothetical protein